MSAPKVLLAWGAIPEPALDLIGDRLEVRYLDTSGSPDEVWQAALAALPGVHAVYGFGRVDTELLDSAPDLEVIIVRGSGYDRVDVDAATAHGVAVVHAAGAAYIPVAEHAIGLMLSLLKWIAAADRHAHATGTQRSNIETFTTYGGMPSVLWGKTIGIVGFGFIGRELARKCIHGFDMDVLAFDPFYDPLEAERQGVRLCADLDEMLPQCDIVSVNAPLVEATRGIIGKAQLAAMKPTALLINAARGGLVDTEALVEALAGGVIAGAGLDVTEPEPLPDGHPLLGMDNVVLTPHIGGVATEFMGKMALSTIGAGLDVLSGRRPIHLVNPEAWPAFLERHPTSTGEDDLHDG